MTISLLDIALRLTLVVILCGAIGLERETRDQPARVLVGMGAAIFTLLSAYGFSDLERPGAPIDPTRVAAQIVTGVGFLGAGAIIHQGLAVRGLTTAAAVWISAAIGMACGVGFYSLALAGSALVLIALLVFRHIRKALLARVRTDRFVLEVEVEHEGDLTAARLHLMIPPGPQRAALVAAVQDRCASAHAKRGLEDVRLEPV